MRANGEGDIDVDVDVEGQVEAEVETVGDVHGKVRAEVEGDGFQAHCQAEAQVEVEPNGEGDIHVGVNVEGKVEAEAEPEVEAVGDVQVQVEGEGEVEDDGVDAQGQADVEADEYDVRSWNASEEDEFTDHGDEVEFDIFEATNQWRLLTWMESSHIMEMNALLRDSHRGRISTTPFKWCLDRDKPLDISLKLLKEMDFANPLIRAAFHLDVGARPEGARLEGSGRGDEDVDNWEEVVVEKMGKNNWKLKKAEREDFDS
ncbi:hypothetical protein LR48_Vigan04g114000 [Vigna angularis]|uniref:Uncharacterized protein n=1 Tax=Phaseolus angularis TaxID=3914 RepID=A0A0L9UEI6_PHAAN|nr:hypothetical protein LR48_Vigan04g114000 [Vigna angularis]